MNNIFKSLMKYKTSIFYAKYYLIKRNIFLKAKKICFLYFYTPLCLKSFEERY